MAQKPKANETNVTPTYNPPAVMRKEQNVMTVAVVNYFDPSKYTTLDERRTVVSDFASISERMTLSIYRIIADIYDSGDWKSDKGDSFPKWAEKELKVAKASAYNYVKIGRMITPNGENSIFADLNEPDPKKRDFGYTALVRISECAELFQPIGQDGEDRKLREVNEWRYKFTVSGKPMVDENDKSLCEYHYIAEETGEDFWTPFPTDKDEIRMKSTLTGASVNAKPVKASLLSCLISSGIVRRDMSVRELKNALDVYFHKDKKREVKEPDEKHNEKSYEKHNEKPEENPAEKRSELLKKAKEDAAYCVHAVIEMLRVKHFDELAEQVEKALAE